MIEYLGRYAHKVAITSHRIKEISGGDDSIQGLQEDGSKGQSMALTHEEFVEDWLHILPIDMSKFVTPGTCLTKAKLEISQYVSTIEVASTMPKGSNINSFTRTPKYKQRNIQCMQDMQ
ncbi:MAG: transposase [Saprospiraceae bacterium]|nr:transposase [Saprospiraceae bacterium]